MSFSFGAATQQSATSTGFGGFGQTPATSTAGGFGGFGQTPAATSTPFGQQQATQQPAASTGFGGFGQTPAAATSTAGGFGGFGQTPAPTSTAGGFGGFGGFGQTPAAATSTPFGQTATSAPATSNSFSFGAATATSAPATSNAFSFGNNTTTNTGGLFGASAKPSFSLNTPSVFGAKPTTGFGTGFAQQQAPANANQQRDQQIYQLLAQVDQEARKAAAPSITSEDYKPDTIWTALALMKSYWDPTSPNCRFKHYFYNVVDPQEVLRYVKPENHDKAAWEAAQAANPNPTT